METLLRQKVCKIKHNFLITKQLHRKKLLLVGCFSEANGSGIFIPKLRGIFPLSTPQGGLLLSGLDGIRIAFLATKKPDKFTTYQVLFL
ncbi:MAG: hypothetical protein C0525_06330 [Flavobacterium sp.]|jgi:hypothetical protein|uniref:hypothetical protein n=1 Tax=Flavobacterium TaxID=237 RepID=UPI0025C45194|nr:MULTISPECIES: hypothetical protein [Flavobacterium]MBA4134323.1 hypothetical protein [Flavobacterium sp.]